MADLSTILPSPDAATEHAEIKGAKLPSVASAWVAEPPTACAACPKRATSAGGDGTHPCFSGLSLPVVNALNWHSDLSDIQNGLNSNIRAIQMMISAMQFMAHGLYGISDQNYANTTARAYYKLNSASGYSVTLQRMEGDADPNALSYSTQRDNPEWPAPEEPRLLTETWNHRLPANGRLRIVGPSLLAGHAGWLMIGNSIPATVDVGDTFTVTLATPIGAGALTRYPVDDDSQISAVLEYYVGGFREDWTNPRDIEPLYCVPTEKIVSLPATQDILLAATRMKPPASAADMQVIARVASDASTADLSSACWSLGRVEHTGGGYASYLDLTGLDLAQYDQLTITYWGESAADAAIPCGQRRCKHDVMDWSGSHGDVHGGAAAYCGRASTASGAADYKPECLQYHVCDAFEIDTPTSPLSHALQATHGLPWKLRQMMAGVPRFELSRNAAPSLSSLANLNTDLPAGYHEQIIWSTHRGGWGAVIDDPEGLPTEGQGLELLWHDGDTYGPGGNHIAGRLADLGGATADRLTLSQITEASAEIDPHNGFVTGQLGKYQRCGDLDYDLVVPDITAEAEQEFLGGTIYLGYWDEDFAPCEVGDAVYFWRVKLRNDFDPYARNTRWRAWGGEKLIASIISASYSAGEYQFELQNAIISASSMSSASEERETSWRSAGTIAPLPDPYRVNNYRCASRGPQRHLAHVGDVARLSGDGMPERLARRMWITAVDPVGGSKQSWLADDNARRVTSELATFALGYGSIDETIESITIKRASDAVTLTGYEGSPFPTSLDKDVFVYEEIEDEEAETKALHIKFSHLNYTNYSADYIMHVVVGTSGWTYDFSLNLLTDYIWGVLTLRKTYTFERDIVSLSIPGMTRLGASPGPRSSWPATGYTVEETTSKSWVIGFPQQLAGERVVLNFTLAGTFDGTEAEYYDAYIGTLHGASIPALEIEGETYEDYGRRGAVLTVRDENGLLHDWATSDSDFEGLTLAVRSDGAAHWDNLSVATATANSAAADTALVAGTDYVWFGAEGELWGKAALSAGQCLYLNLKLANRKSMATQLGFDSIRETLESLLEA